MQFLHFSENVFYKASLVLCNVKVVPMFPFLQASKQRVYTANKY